MKSIQSIKSLQSHTHKDHNNQCIQGEGAQIQKQNKMVNYEKYQKWEKKEVKGKKESSKNGFFRRDWNLDKSCRSNTSISATEHES